VIVIVMGVSGSGKSLVGIALAREFGWRFVDGDDLHPVANVAKMASGHALNDADRAPWLESLGAQMDAWLAAGQNGVITCSALRRAYRDTLRKGRGTVEIVFLDVPRDVLAVRVAARHDHFMPASLLDSQLATLERPTSDENAITVQVGASTTAEETANLVIAALRREI
jgi:gluconokinase